MEETRTDETLMLAYRDGEGAAFEALYARHRGRLYRYLLHQCGRREQADEMFQEIWMSVIRARNGYEVSAKFTTWLYQIAHNRLTDHWRALSHRPPAPDDAMERAEREPDPSTPERQLSAFEERRRLQLALEELPADQREAVMLRLEQELHFFSGNLSIISSIKKHT